MGALDAAIANRWIPPVIAVIIDVREGVLMLNSPVFGDWADFLLDEVLPFIDGRYRTIRAPEGRALMGHSTGGYAAMLLPLLHPGIWSAVGLNDASVLGACNPKVRSRKRTEFSEYRYLDAAARAWTQIAIATAPDLTYSLYYRAPWSDGAGSDVEVTWNARCLTNPDMLRENRDAFGAPLHYCASVAHGRPAHERVGQSPDGRSDAAARRGATGSRGGGNARQPSPRAVHLPGAAGDFCDGGGVVRSSGIARGDLGCAEGCAWPDSVRRRRRPVMDRLPLRTDHEVTQMTGAWRAAVCCLMMVFCGFAAASSTYVHRIESEAVAGNRAGITSTRRLLVYTPEGYDESRRVYPVIYWIPGWQTPASSEYVGALDKAISSGHIPPVITVTIDVREGVLMLNSVVFGNWADFLVNEVVPFIDGEYRTIKAPEGRSLMGHSTGGYGALLLPLLYPGVWSTVGLNDASVWGVCNWGRWSR